MSRGRGGSAAASLWGRQGPFLAVLDGNALSHPSHWPLPGRNVVPPTSRRQLESFSAARDFVGVSRAKTHTAIRGDWSDRWGRLYVFDEARFDVTAVTSSVKTTYSTN